MTDILSRVTQHESHIDKHSKPLKSIIDKDSPEPVEYVPAGHPTHKEIEPIPVLVNHSATAGTDLNGYDGARQVQADTVHDAGRQVPMMPACTACSHASSSAAC